MILQILRSQSLGSWLGDLIGALCVFAMFPIAYLTFILILTYRRPDHDNGEPSKRALR